METKYAIVIDDQGYKIESVLVDFIESDDDTTEIPQGYTLQDGENLVYDDISIALHMKTPRWNGETWEETATPEEIAATLPELVEYPITENQLLGQQITDLELAAIEQGQQITDLELKMLKMEAAINV